ncbi:hypothetical protein OYC64_004719 [Pagothenia borchgrevinki]|uniref:Uncharacterized protein n=1 Tax=Pagothenia borchgrevinki TaxID=8213 RepID=A0ABD2GD21_PAGBO
METHLIKRSNMRNLDLDLHPAVCP